MTLRLVEVDLPLRRPLRTATGSARRRRTLLVGLDDGAVVGWGEAAPFPGTDAETVDDLWRAFLSGDELPPTGRAALEAARLDARARRTGTGVGNLLGCSGPPAVPSMAIPAGPAPDVLAAVDGAVASGCGAVKLKWARGADPGVIRDVVDRHRGLTVGVDANGTLADVSSAVAIETAGAAYLEQPFAAHDLEAHRRLRHRLSDLEVVVDESVRSADDARRVIDAGACDRICLKPGRLGPGAVMRIAAAASDGGIGIKIGGMFDSAVGRAWAAILAGHPASRFDDVAPAGAYFTADVGTAATPAGIRIDPDPGPLTVRSAEIDDALHRDTVDP
ncbi:MAG: enolase C-terminal domain-like protein [Acidimicrobiia bacterium]|nr:enolase C-terminal domain-like protein [Acidimicrobiia bacterium]